MSPEFQMLKDSWDACKQRQEKLKYSLEKNQPCFPIDIPFLKSMLHLF